MPNIGAVKSCLAPTQHKGELEQDFTAKLVKQLPSSHVQQFFGESRGGIHKLLSIILKLRILVLLPVLSLPYVVKVKNYSLIDEWQRKNRF
jgi:hypothetical protein